MPPFDTRRQATFPRIHVRPRLTEPDYARIRIPLERDALEVAAALHERVSRNLRSGPGSSERMMRSGYERARRHDERRRLLGRLAKQQRRHRRLLAAVRVDEAHRVHLRLARPQLERQRDATVGLDGDARDVAEPRALVVAHDDELVEEPAVGAAARALDRRFAPLAGAVASAPTASCARPLPCADRSRKAAERLQVLRRIGVAAERILAVERAAADAEVGGLDAARRNLDGGRPLALSARRRLVPVLHRDARAAPLPPRLDTSSPSCSSRRRRAAGEALQPAAHARRELRRIAETHRGACTAAVVPASTAPCRAFEVDDDDRAFALALLRVREDLARPLAEPAVGELDLPHRQRIRIGEAEQQRVAVRRIAGHALRVRHQVVGHRGHRAVEHLGEPVVRVQLLPQVGRRHAARQPVHDDQLLADVQSALQQLGLDALRARGRLRAAACRQAEYWFHSACHIATAWSAASASRSSSGCGLPA